MKIEHTALYVKDLEQTKDFFVQFFGAKAGSRYDNKVTCFSSYFLSFQEGSRLEIMTRPQLVSQTNALHTGYVHVAFSVGSTLAVDQLTNRLQLAGYTVVSGPRRTGDGYYESCVQGPEQILIEITE